MAAVVPGYEGLRGEGAVETKRDVVLELDAHEWALVHVLGVQHDELGAVGLGNVELHHDVAVVLVPLLPAVPAQPWDKHWLPHHAV